MNYISHWRRAEREKGREDAREETLQVLRELIIDKFGQVPDWVSKRLVGADNITLLGWAKALIKTNNLEDLFA